MESGESYGQCERAGSSDTTPVVYKEATALRTRPCWFTVRVPVFGLIPDDSVPLTGDSNTKTRKTVDMYMFKDTSYKPGKEESVVTSYSSMFTTTLLRTGTKRWSWSCRRRELELLSCEQVNCDDDGIGGGGGGGDDDDDDDDDDIDIFILFPFVCSIAVGVGFYGNSETNDGVYQLTYSLYNANHTLAGVENLPSLRRWGHQLSLLAFQDWMEWIRLSSVGTGLRIVHQPKLSIQQQTASCGQRSGCPTLHCAAADELSSLTVHLQGGPARGRALSLYLTDPTAPITDIQRAVVSSMSHPVSAAPSADGCTTQDYMHTDRYHDCP
ncbi:hypothetical protein NFI96_001640 [Prochilodus magdalenae]|nr:hypothetical protein NFI96_001640 [Prochilodus magdalenae]